MSGSPLDHPRVHSSEADLPRRAPQRIVSLVPSLSESLVALGLVGRLVGVTEYCVEPPGAFASLPRVGGTKDADVAAILALEPDLVIANREENTARVVRQLAEAGVDVWVTYPRTVREGAGLLRALAGLGAEAEVSARVVEPVFRAIERAEAMRESDRKAGRAPVRVFCPIWRDPWMAVGADTYAHDLIELCGGANVFAELHEPDLGEVGRGRGRSAVAGSARVGSGRVGRDPGRSNRRYPIVTLEEIERAQPEIVLLPSEPYAFSEADRAAFAGLDCPAVRAARIDLIDGTLLTWYGPRIAEAIRGLGQRLATA